MSKVKSRLKAMILDNILKIDFVYNRLIEFLLRGLVKIRFLENAIK